MTDLALIQDFAVILAIGGLVSVVFARLKWPKVIGYILAGVLMSRHTWGGSFLIDETSIQTLGQLGIIFLMFTLGLEFSTSAMKRMKGVALPTAMLDTLVMTWLGYTVGTRVFGWGTVPSLFLGTAICDSSTTLLAKIIDEMQWSRRVFARYVIGTSICEDIVTVGIIALITGVATGGGMDLAAVGMSLGGLAVFFLATFVFGLILVPRLLTSVARRHDDEALLLTLLGCCLFVTWIAYRLNFSIAFGAFLVGVFGASSEVRDRLHALADPLRSLFAAVFFVSIGLLIDPAACLANWRAILLLSAVVMFGKGLDCFLGGLVTGESVKTAVQMGFGLAQIGEFAYMVALLYVTVTGDIASPMYQIVVAVSLLTTILNPVMIRISDPVGDWLENHCPRRLANALETYRAFVLKLREDSAEEPQSRREARKAVVMLGVIAVLEFAVATAIGMLSRIDYSKFSTLFERYDQFCFCLVANIFLVAMAALILRLARRLADALGLILVTDDSARWQTALRHVIRTVVLIFVGALFFLEWLMINVNLAPAEPWALWTIAAIVLIVAVFGWRFFLKAGHRAVVRFEEAVSADERMAKRPKELVITIPEDRMSKFTLDAASPAVGGTVVTLNIRAKTGASIVSVYRDGKLTRNIGPEWEFQVGDTLVAIGAPNQIAALKDMLGITA